MAPPLRIHQPGADNGNEVGDLRQALRLRTKKHQSGLRAILTLNWCFNMRFAPLLFYLVVSGCSDTSTMSWPRLQAEVSKHPQDTISYCGSKKGYDFFHFEPQLPSGTKSARDYRVSSAQSPLAIPRHPFSTDQSTWLSYEAAAGLTK
jgi:hypothetical protein